MDINSPWTRAFLKSVVSEVTLHIPLIDCVCGQKPKVFMANKTNQLYVICPTCFVGTGGSTVPEIVSEMWDMTQGVYK